MTPKERLDNDRRVSDGLTDAAALARVWYLRASTFTTAERAELIALVALALMRLSKGDDNEEAREIVLASLEDEKARRIACGAWQL